MEYLVEYIYRKGTFADTGEMVLETSLDPFQIDYFHKIEKHIKRLKNYDHVSITNIGEIEQ